MNTIDRSHRHRLATAVARRRASRDELAPAPRVRPQLLADGVVAGYIHDISTRHRAVDSEDERYELAVDREAA
jgi:hypothetical protein